VLSANNVPVMRTAFKCRAYPDAEQAALFGRTFGCVRLVGNKTLAERHRAWHTHGRRVTYAETDAALTGWKKTQESAFLSEVSSVPLQQLAELGLSTRHWTCPGCRTRHDRDINAAKNILAAGRAVAGGTPGEVCGADVRRQGSSLPQSATKQKHPRREP
jgi:putative transposase